MTSILITVTKSKQMAVMDKGRMSTWHECCALWSNEKTSFPAFLTVLLSRPSFVQIIFQELKLNHNTASVFVRVTLTWISGHFLMWKHSRLIHRWWWQSSQWGLCFITPSLWGSLLDYIVFVCVCVCTSSTNWTIRRVLSSDWKTQNHCFNI